MGSIFHLKKFPNKEFIEEVALEVAVDPAFIEKDWFAVQLIALLTEYKNDKGIQIVFSGGTSLSKGYDLIKRFSEDLDFILYLPEEFNLSRSERRSFRKKTIAAIVKDDRFIIKDSEIESFDDSKSFKSPIKYKYGFKHGSLRPYLKLEMSFRDFKLSPEKRPIQSIISKVAKENPETNILCISPIETAGDKLSALSWRILVRDRNDEDDDPTLIRHLHDLAALETSINQEPILFAQTAKQSLEQDQLQRGGHSIEVIPVLDRLNKTLDLLNEDPLYRGEYETFVRDLSYADEKDQINFDEACAALERIIKIYCSKKK